MILVTKVLDAHELKRAGRLDRVADELAIKRVEEERDLVEGTNQLPPEPGAKRYGDLVLIMADVGAGPTVREKALKAIAGEQSINHGQLPVRNCPTCGRHAIRWLREATSAGPVSQAQDELGHWWEVDG